VHLPSPPPRRESVIIPVDLPEESVEKFPMEEIKDLATLEMQRLLTRSIGDRFIQKGRSCALEVPSVIVPGELNILINPEHPDFMQLKIGSPELFAFDARLLSARKVL